MDAIVCKCPSCGGKVTFNYEIEKWVCSYCNKSFNALFANTGSATLEKKDLIEKSFYRSYCNHCKSKFISETNDESTCPFCGTKTNAEDTPFIATACLDNQISDEDAYKIYKSKLSYCPTRLKKVYLENNFKLQYLNCSLIDGSLEVEYSGMTIRYIFINLLIPNIDFEDYRFLYEVGNNGISTSEIYDFDLLKMNQNLHGITNFEDLDNNNTDEFITSMIDYLKKKYKNSPTELKIHNHLSIKKGVFLPVYVNSIEYEGEEYKQYVFGNKTIKKDVIIKYPQKENNKKESKEAHSLLVFFLILVPIVIFIALLLKIYIAYIGMFIIPFILFLLTLYVYFSSNYKDTYKSNSRVISKEEYIEQILENSNYVKKI